MSEKQSELENLESEGWERMFIASEPRLSEAVEAYKEAGFDVHLEPLPKESECTTCGGIEEKTDGACRICFEGVEDMFKIIYVRQIKKEASSDGESQRKPR